MADENGTSVEFDSTSGESGPSQDDAVKRYEREQGVETEQEEESTESSDSEDNSQNQQSEDNSESESEQEDNSESESESEDNSEEESEDNSSSDFSEFFEEFQQNGELSEDSYTKLEEKGIPRSTVDDYIQSRTQLGEAITSTAHEIVGGQEEYSAMAEWMRNNLDQNQLSEYNKAVDSGNFKKATEAVRQIKQKYDEAVGSETSMVGDGTDPGGTSVAGYNSQREMQSDMQDPRYHTDPHFREQVRKKLANAKF